MWYGFSFIIAELHLPHSSEGHEAPPEGVQEGPGAGGVVLLGKVDQGGEGEDRHPHEEHEQAELLVGLVEGVDEGLEAGKVTDELENPHDPHHTDQADYLASLAHDLKVLKWWKIEWWPWMVKAISCPAITS